MHTYILCNTSVTVWVQAAAKSGASQIDASEEQKRAKAERAEAKAKAAAAKRTAEIRSVIETILNEPAPPG